MKNFIQWGVFTLLLISVQACLCQEPGHENYEYWIIRVGDDLECSGVLAAYDPATETFTVHVVGQPGVTQGEVERTFARNGIRFVPTQCAIVVIKDKNETQRQAEDAMLLAIEAGGLIDKVVEYRMASR